MCFAEYGMSLAWCFYVAAVKYGQERENNTQANPFYSPMLECSDKGGLLPLLYDYQYVLGRLTIERCPNSLWQAWNKLRFCSVRGNIRKRCTSPWLWPSTAEPATEVECVFVLAQTGTHSILFSVNFFFFGLLTICATPNSLVWLQNRKSVDKNSQRPLLTISVQAPTCTLF